ncbi:MAG TPA: PEGA domain-containing protein, partial [Polyangiaceae bacterium]|nr:PEGA domain-containing protein [Polyangiaceae bacterium]
MLALGLASFGRPLCAAAAEAAADGDAATPAPGGSGDKRAEAERHFQRGLELANQAAWDAALAEFLT